MGLSNCGCRCNCTMAALIAAVVVGVLTTFLQLTSAIAVSQAALGAAFVVAVVYLAVLLVAAALERSANGTDCLCRGLNSLLAGILGTILFAVILMTVDIAAASLLGSILLGLLAFFFALMLTASACLVRELLNCER